MQRNLTNTMPSPAWHQNIRIGDIVLFRFPFSDLGEAAEYRPCLVFNIEICGGQRLVEIADATSADTAANTGAEIRVCDPAAIKAAGLSRPIRFVCARRLLVGLDHPGWEIDPPLRLPSSGISMRERFRG